MGYTLQRSLADAGILCRVLSPNKIDRSGSQRIKTDARDAMLIAWMLKNQEAETLLFSLVRRMEGKKASGIYLTGVTSYRMCKMARDRQDEGKRF